MQDERKYSGLAITSLVLGILSFIIGFLPIFGWIIIVLAIVFGFISLSKIKKNNLKGKGLAITGIIFGFVALLLLIIVWAFLLSLSSIKTEGNSTIGRDAAEILLINKNCESKPLIVPISCEATTGEVTINVKGRYIEKVIYSRLKLKDGTDAYSELRLDNPLNVGDTSTIPGPSSQLTSNVKSATIQYDVCGNAGCIGCTKTILC